MVGANFQLDRSKISEIENNNKVIVPEFLSVSFLGRLRERIAHDRPLCKHFLKLIRHAVTEFLKQLPPGSRSSASANKYESMTPVAVSKVAVVYMDGGEKKTSVAPMLTNTSSVDTVKFLGLLCYMVHIKDAAYLWLVEEFCAGVEVPTIAKSKPSAKNVDQAAVGGAGLAASAGNGNSAREIEAGAGTPRPPVAGRNGGSVEVIGAGMGAIAPLAAAAAVGGGLASGVGAGATVPPAAAAALSGGLAGAVGEGATAPPAAAAARGGGLAGGVGAGATAPLAAAAAVGGGLAGGVGEGATAPPAAAAALSGGLASGVGAGATAPLAAAAAVGGGLALVVSGGAVHGPESGLADVGEQERCHLLANGAVVASGVALPMRSHCGRDAVPLSVLAVRDVKVVEGHGEDVYRSTADASTTFDGGAAGGVAGVLEPDLQEASGNLSRGGSQQTLGAADIGGAVLLWQVRDIG